MLFFFFSTFWMEKHIAFKKKIEHFNCEINNKRLDPGEKENLVS